MTRAALALLVSATVATSMAQTTSLYKPLQTRATGIEVIARLSLEPKHVTVLGDGRIIFSVSPETRKTIAVAELMPDGAIKPFPSKEWALKPGPGGTGMTDVAAIASDAPSGFVVILDIGTAESGGKIIVWDTKQNKLYRTIALPPRKLGNFKFMQDLALDMKRRCVYLVAHDMKKQTGAILVVDFKDGTARPIGMQRLHGKGSLETGTSVTRGMVRSVEEGLNTPIDIDPAYEWVYVAGQGGSRIFRVRADDLANPNIPPEELVSKFEDYGDKSLATSIAADASGHVFVCEGSNSKIGVYSPDRGYRVILEDSALNWPDDITLGPDGYLYITVNHLRRMGMLGKKDERLVDMPYSIGRAKLPW
jgi:hypothetical protein